MNTFYWRNDLTELLGCKYPVMLAGMGGVSRYQLAAAVAEAGGFGCLGLVREPASYIREQVANFREHSNAVFGVNLIPVATEKRLLCDQLRACVDLAVPIVVLFWDVDQDAIRFLKQAGAKVIYQVGRHSDAKLALDEGVDALIVQGVEAGGHVRGNSPLFTLLPEIAEYSPVPLIAAGGITSGADLVRAMNLGASGVCCGTLFLATEESNANEFHKNAIIMAHDEDTVITDKFWRNWHEPAPVRVLKSCVDLLFKTNPSLTRVVGMQDGKPVYLYATDSPLQGATGQLELMALYAGASCGGITEIYKAAEVLQKLISTAECLLGNMCEGEFYSTPCLSCLNEPGMDEYINGGDTHA